MGRVVWHINRRKTGSWAENEKKEVVFLINLTLELFKIQGCMNLLTILALSTNAIECSEIRVCSST